MTNLRKIIIVATVLPFLIAAALIGAGTLVGDDKDNNLNTFIQPIGEEDKQHMENTDVLIGNDGDNLLIGMLGPDTILGMEGNDILVGGPENFRTGKDEQTGEERGSNSDVLVGGPGDDINVWSPGDGSDAFLGGAGSDTMLFGPLVHPNGDKNTAPTISQANGRDIVKVDIANKPQFTCKIEQIPQNSDLDFDYLVRFLVNDNLKVTVVLNEVENVVCPSPDANSLLYANLTSNTPTTFNKRPLSDFDGTLLGTIVEDRTPTKGTLNVKLNNLLGTLEKASTTINIKKSGAQDITLDFTGPGEKSIDLAPGDYTVNANAVAGHKSPVEQNITIASGQTSDVTLDFMLEPGTTEQGKDDDNAQNTLIQPNGEEDKQHMENTDVLLADEKGSVLIGILGRDTLVGNEGNDILIGGPENFEAPNSDIIYGGKGDDINIWAPGDGSDAFLGGDGTDAIILAPFAGSAAGDIPVLKEVAGRDIPQVSVSGSDKAKFSCEIVTVPSEENLGYEQLVRFSVNNVLKVTVRLHKVEFVYCPSATADSVKVAELAKGKDFSDVALSTLADTLIGEIMQP